MLKINGKTYKTPELGFNEMCQLEDMGVQIIDMQRKPFGCVRAFVALAMQTDAETAGNAIEEHLMNGGKLDDVYTEMVKAASESGFFQALNKAATEENTES